MTLTDSQRIQVRVALMEAIEHYTAYTPVSVFYSEELPNEALLVGKVESFVWSVRVWFDFTKGTYSVAVSESKLDWQTGIDV